MASIGRRRRSRIETVRSARLVSAILVALGALCLLALVLLPLVPLIVPTAAPPPEGAEGAEAAATSVPPLLAWLQALPEPDWRLLLGGTCIATLLLWLGYVLRVLSVIAETQLVDLDAD